MDPRIKFFSVLLAGAASVSAAGGRVPEVVRESADVSLVEVPVNVTGRDGKPITGLTAANFVLEDEGTRQEIASVDIVDLHRRSPVPALPSQLPAAARRHFLFLFDLSYATAKEIVRSREAAIRFVEKGMAAEDLVAVADTSAEKGARLLLTFTADRHQIRDAIRGVALPHEINQARDPLGFAFSMPGDPISGTTGEEEYKPSMTNVDPTSAIKLYAKAAQMSADDQSVTRVQRHLGDMSNLGAALDAVEGRKTIIYFSEGFDGRLLLGSVAQEKSNDETRSDNDAMFSGMSWTLDVDRRYSNGPLQRDLRDTISVFRRSDCVMYAVDITGLTASGDVGLGSRNRGEDSLYVFANETGGELIRSGNDLDQQMLAIAERTSLTYVLAFRPTKVLGEGKFHNLKVKVNAKGARVSARAGYFEAKGFRAMSPLERSLAAADVIMHEKAQGDFGVDVLAVPFASGRIARVALLIDIPSEALAAPSPSERLDLGLYVYVTDENGKLSDYFTRQIRLNSEAEVEKFARGGMVYYGVSRLLPGKYHVRAYVRSERDGRYGFRVVPLNVPETGLEAFRALPPVFVNEGETGIRIRDASAVSAQEGEPFQVGDSNFVPVVTPDLASGTHSRVCLMLYQRAEAVPLSPFNIDAQILDAGGRFRGAANFRLIGRTSPDSQGLVKVLVDFSVADLSPGDYALRVVFRDAHDTSRQSEGEAKFRVS